MTSQPQGTLAPVVVARPRRRRRAGVGVPRLLRQVVLAIAAVLALYPVWFMLTTAFKDQRDYAASPYRFP